MLARTPNAPIVKEVKPAAMIGYRGVRVQTVSDKHGNNVLFAPKTQALKTGMLSLREDTKGYTQKQSFTVPVVDTGENGVLPEESLQRLRRSDKWSTSLQKRSQRRS